MRRWLVAAALCSVAVGVWWTLRPRPPVNLVLIVGCTVRQDQVTPYGGLPQVTPFLAEVAARGTVFEDGIVSAPWTKAALTALFTGQDPADVGMIEPGPGRNSRALAAEATTLAEMLSGAGYRTAGGTANPNGNEVFGLAQGLETFVDSAGLWREAGVVKTPGPALTAQVLDRLDTLDGSGPLYLQVVLVDAHQPYQATAEEAAPYLEDNPPLRVARYRAALRRFDEAVALLVDELSRRGVTEQNSVFVVVNDHGEGLATPTHHGGGHGNFTYLTSTGMVWILWGRGVARGHRVRGLASQLDVVPTLLGLLGLEGYAGSGHDLAAQARGAPATDRAEAYTDTWFLTSQSAAVFTAERACHLNFQMGDPLAHSRQPEGCFDRAVDPGEAGPIGPIDPVLAERLGAWRTARYEAYLQWPHTRDANVDGALSSELEALGYVQGAD